MDLTNTNLVNGSIKLVRYLSLLLCDIYIRISTLGGIDKGLFTYTHMHVQIWYYLSRVFLHMTR